MGDPTPTNSTTDFDCQTSLGKLSLDLLAKAKDDTSSKTVIIETQLGGADHSHLGQLLAYAAGLDVKIVIWIADEFRDEYRQVLEWINEQTPIDIGFFAVIVELLQIECLEDSPVALEFKPVIAPNQWKKSVKPTGETERQKRYRNFYEKLIDELREDHEFTNARAAQPDTWHYFSSGHRGVTYCVRFHRGSQVIVYVRIYKGAMKTGLHSLTHSNRTKQQLKKHLEVHLNGFDPLKNKRLKLFLPEKETLIGRILMH